MDAVTDLEGYADTRWDGIVRWRQKGRVVPADREDLVTGEGACAKLVSYAEAHLQPALRY